MKQSLKNTVGFLIWILSVGLCVSGLTVFGQDVAFPNFGFGEAIADVFSKLRFFWICYVSAIALYKKYGFEVTDRGPVTEHPLFYYTGDMLLMTCAV